MIRHVGFARARSIEGVRRTVTALIAAGLCAVGLLVAPAVASADPVVNNCSQMLVNIVCVGQINGDLVTVNVGDVDSGNDLAALTNNLNDVFVEVAHIEDINILSVDLNTLVQTAVNTFVTTTTTVTTKTCTAVVTPPVTATQSSAITISCS
jgi:hypothetical protein